MTRGAAAAVLAVVALPATALAATRVVSPPARLAAQTAAVKRHGGPPVLLPDGIRWDGGRLYASGGRRGPRGGGYALHLDAAPRCGDATACFFAEFSARRGRPSFRRTVRLAGGRTGYYKPLSCGASCSPPAIEWIAHRRVYGIQANVLGPERAAMVRLANQAIAHGPR